MMARALALRHHLEDHAGLVGEALIERGYELEVVMMNEVTPSPTLDGFDVVVILGSKSAAYDKEVEEAWFGRELDLIADAQRRSIPILGICFGAQALCIYHGGFVEPSSRPEIGWYEVQTENGSGISSGPWFEYHFDHCRLPDSAQLWATSADAVQAFAVGRDVGVQFHPEVDDLQLADWFSGGDQDARDAGVDVAALIDRTRRETPAARLRAAELVDRFLDHAASYSTSYQLRGGGLAPPH